MESTSTPPDVCNVAIPTARRSASRTDTSTIRTAARSAAVQVKTVAPRGSITIPSVVPNAVVTFIAVLVHMGLTMILTGVKCAVQCIHHLIVHVTDNTRMPMVVPNVVRIPAALIVQLTGITWIPMVVNNVVLHMVTTKLIALVHPLDLLVNTVIVTSLSVVTSVATITLVPIVPPMDSITIPRVVKHVAVPLDQYGFYYDANTAKHVAPDCTTNRNCTDMVILI